jgi:uncharacterized protein (TIGR04255 family)
VPSAVNPTLPKFDRPPVYEVVLGVQFKPLTGFSIPHYGLYWADIREQYPNYEVHPPLSSTVEQFGSEAKNIPQMGVEFVQAPDVRAWFVNSADTQLLQVQKDRFLQNWRRKRDTDVYPHYDNLKPKFFEEWEGFCRFLKSVGMEHPDVNQCEVTYVNHIDLAPGSRCYSNLNDVVSCWSGRYSGNFLSDPESVNFAARYLLPEKAGRLHISMQPAIRRQDAKEILRLTLTVRGKPNSSELAGIQEWLDLGHEWIVRGFSDITTESMHKMWGRTQ